MSLDMTSFYPTHNFNNHAGYRDVEAAYPNSLKSHIWTWIHRCGIHSRVCQYDIRHHSDCDSNSATYEYHFHINYSLYRLCHAGHQPTSAYHYGVLVADCKKATKSRRSRSLFMRWIGIFVPGVTTSGPSLNNLLIVFSSQTIVDCTKASEYE